MSEGEPQAGPWPPRAFHLCLPCSHWPPRARRFEAQSSPWEQLTDGQTARWALNGSRVIPAFSVEARGLTIGARDLLVAVSITSEVGDGIAASHSILPLFRSGVEARPAGLDPSPQVVLSAAEGEGLARAIVAKMRQARSTHGTDGGSHVFIAGPLGLAVPLGRLLNTFGALYTYEFLPGEVPPYRLAARLRGTD